MSSNIKIKKICQQCGQEFIARTTVTKYCGDNCAKKAYKVKVREEKIKSSEKQLAIQKESIKPKTDLNSYFALKTLDYLTVKEAAVLLKCDSRTIYLMLKSKRLPSINLSQRKTRILKKDIDALFESSETIKTTVQEVKIYKSIEVHIPEHAGSSPLLVVISSYLSSISVHILMNALKLVFSDDGDNFRIISVDNQQDVLVVYVQSTTRSAVCPNCCITSKRIHSYYTRKIADLPVFGKTSRIILRSRKFYCHQDECPFKIFTERFESHFRPYKRRTERLESKIRQLGLLAGGRPAQRICTILSIPTSDTTILRLIEKCDFSPAKGVTAIGVDDWAYKKRKSYGSILVNLHTGKVIDLLPDREQETLRKWLQERPEIEVMSRDRYSNYRKAITLGAPQSIQVTDRWHLLKNLSEAVQKVLIRHYSKATALLANKQLRVDDQQIAENQSTLSENRSSPDSAHGGIRLKRFEQLKELQKKGYSIRAMARHLCMHRQTVKNYLDMETLPRKSQCKINPLEKFFTHIKKRMEEEPSILITTLWQELRTQGYKGAYSTFSEGLKFYGIRVGKKAGFTKELPNHGAATFKPSSAAIWFLSDQQNLWDDQRNIIRELCKSSKELNKTFILVQSFRKIMAEKSGDTKLREWIEKSSTSGLKEIASFAKGLLADCPAVENALTLPWSNGPVEGNVNRLKMIKRQMYGRAGFDLLRKRVVYAPS